MSHERRSWLIATPARDQNISLEEGCIFEPLSVGVQVRLACVHPPGDCFAEHRPTSLRSQAVAKVADLHSNQNIAIFGAGPVGLACMAGGYPFTWAPSIRA